MGNNGQVDEFLSAYPDEVQKIASGARQLLLEVLPDIDELVDKPAKLLGYRYGPGYKGLVCTLIPSQSGVKLGIFRGVEVSDPRGLLQGSGKIHRHVPLKSVSDLRQAGLRPLLKRALVAWKKRSRASA